MYIMWGKEKSRWKDKIRTETTFPKFENVGAHPPLLRRSLFSQGNNNVSASQFELVSCSCQAANANAVGFFLHFPSSEWPYDWCWILLDAWNEFTCTDQGGLGTGEFNYLRQRINAIHIRYIDQTHQFYISYEIRIVQCFLGRTEMMRGVRVSRFKPFNLNFKFQSVLSYGRRAIKCQCNYRLQRCGSSSGNENRA